VRLVVTSSRMVSSSGSLSMSGMFGIVDLPLVIPASSVPRCDAQRFAAPLSPSGDSVVALILHDRLSIRRPAVRSCAPLRMRAPATGAD
jgi:hypothetical protein